MVWHNRHTRSFSSESRPKSVELSSSSMGSTCERAAIGDSGSRRLLRPGSLLGLSGTASIGVSGTNLVSLDFTGVRESSSEEAMLGVGLEAGTLDVTGREGRTDAVTFVGGELAFFGRGEEERFFLPARALGEVVFGLGERCRLDGLDALDALGRPKASGLREGSQGGVIGRSDESSDFGDREGAGGCRALERLATGLLTRRHGGRRVCFLCVFPLSFFSSHALHASPPSALVRSTSGTSSGIIFLGGIMGDSEGDMGEGVHSEPVCDRGESLGTTMDGTGGTRGGLVLA